MDQAPNQRATDLIKTGEWYSKTLVGLRGVDLEDCFGKILNVEFPDSGILAYTRFCGKTDCQTKAHMTN